MMLFRKPNRQRKAAQKLSHISAVEFLEDRQLLSVMNSLATDITDDSVLITELGTVTEYASIDGIGNNIDNPELGSTDTQLLRLADADYGDGLSTPAGEDRPSAREISNVIADANSAETNDRYLTDLFWVWGQFIDHDITLTESAHDEYGNPLESFPIEVPTGDVFFDPDGSGDDVINLNRSAFEVDEDGVRQQINQITAFIDGSGIYGSDEALADQLRTFEGGMLATSEGDLLPYGEDGFFLAGDIRANENVALTSMHTIWVREHNRIATELATENPDLTDEELYQQARQIVIGELQAVTFNEFLPALFGPGVVSEYIGYDSTVDPSIANEFSNAAYRFGHTMLSSELLRLDENGNVADEGNIALLNAFFNPSELEVNGIDSLLRGATVNVAQEIDNQIVDDVRNFLFGPPGAGGFDLASLNIQRGRDHGLADYNSTRVALGLSAVENFSDISSDPEVAAKLEMLYGTVDNIDLWVGGLAEEHLPGSSMGETFTAIIVDQFERLRDGDRFWYENVFSGDALAEIGGTTLADVIERNSDVSGLQENVFFAPTIMRLDLAETGSSDVTIRAADGNLEVVDNRTRQVIGSQSLDSVERLMLSSTGNGSLRVTIEGITIADLPGGLIVEAGKGRSDTLIVNGTDQSDTIFVNDGFVDVSGMSMEFTGMERIVVRGTDADDTIEVADGVDIDVDILDTVSRDHMHQGRRGGERMTHRRDNHRPTQGPNRHGSVENDVDECGDDHGMLDQVFASNDLDPILGMPPGKRRP
ncbi:peroxidase family protein [uncultured Gimesia sp.]|uniref:peroxidase family protein n=1 Tax=uncultured Gimesia sp. TaxID=1678688 RepID=UPI0030D7E45C|tara:strand:+ start:149117 stop:151411 length:2295 start_codon:yes stop_codon:yes gene_type:complete